MRCGTLQRCARKVAPESSLPRSRNSEPAPETARSESRANADCSPPPRHGIARQVRIIRVEHILDIREQLARASELAYRHGSAQLPGYFREPSGVLFEIATLGPGFDADEDPAHLGEKLVLPPKFEPLREGIEATLTPISNPRQS